MSLWNRLFLEERPSISLSFFRVAVAWTVGWHVWPTFAHMDDNYFSTAFKTFDSSFFPVPILEAVFKSPEWLILLFVWIFGVSWFFFLIGLFSQISCIVMVVSCYYFYALNSFHVGTLSWDILLVTLFLMCMTPYHGDYFSIDCLRRTDVDAYKKKRPFFIQRLLQMQLGFTYFYTALYKVTAHGTWIKGNPVYYLMNYGPLGVTKTFLLRDFIMDKPQVCYWIGIAIVTVEFSMIFLLFFPRTRLSAIYLGIFFHILLILTLDVPSIFFFMFPFQFLLFINPNDIVGWIEHKRAFNQKRREGDPPVLVYDGQCQFCIRSIKRLQTLDLFSVLALKDLHHIENYTNVHPDLTKDKAMSQMYLIDTNGKLYGGFRAFQRMTLMMPMLYILIPVVYFPGVTLMGTIVYNWVAKNRYLFHSNKVCKNNACFHK
jgi:predicted DCC family thiol-disulfide oxidoreductase YuxK